jgi:hypothetical protein
MTPGVPYADGGRRGGRRGVAAVVLTVLLGALVLTVPASAGTLSPQMKINRRAAIHQVGLRLRQVRFPRGSHQVGAPPAAIGNLLDTAPYTFGGGRNVERHDFWVTPLAPKALLRWVAHHRPRGSHSGSSSSGPGPSSISHEWEWPEAGRVWGSDVIVSAVAYRGGSAVRLDADAVWLFPRPAREHISATARIIDLRIEPGEGEFVEEQEGAPPTESVEVPTRALRISDPAVVRRIARIVNRQRVVQLSGAIGCPEEGPAIAGPGEAPPAPPSVISLSFRAGPHRPVLATVSQREKPGICHEMSFRIGGTWLPELGGGDEVLRALLPERERAVKVDPRRSRAGRSAAAALAGAVGRESHPRNCPGRAIPERDARRKNKNPRSRSALVPAGADEIVLCRYFGSGEGATKGDRRGVGHLARQRIIRRPASVAELTDSFRDLSPVSKGFESCFFDNGASLEAIARYRGEPPVFAFVQLSGCEVATNGRSDAVYLSSTLGAQLRGLTKVASRAA